MKGRQVVVTGMGVVTPLGNDVASTWKGLLAGRSGVRLLTAFDTTEYSTRFGGSIIDFDVSQVMSSKEARRFDPFIHYGLAAAKQAIEQAGIVGVVDPDRAGTAIGSGVGGIGIIEDSRAHVDARGPRKLSPFIVSGSIINMISGQASIEYGLRGPNIAVATACTTGTHNIGLAARMIALGEADVMVAGGAERAATPVGMGGFAAARALSTRNDAPEAASRPWDADRDGFVLSDGAGVLVLEAREHAEARGVPILAELTGFGMSADAHHMTAPPADGAGARRAMQIAINDAGLAPADISYINAHGTSTAAGDVAESQAVESLWGGADAAPPVSSTKSMTGHLLGAAGAIEAVFSVLALRDQIVPPTINLDNPGEGCNLDYVPHKARQMKVQHVLSNSFGFGGTNGSLLFSLEG